MVINRLSVIAGVVMILLLIPFVAMQITSVVNWSVSDFVIMAFLLSITGLTCELILRKVKTLKYRLILVAALLFVFILVWAELAVGIFGTPFAGS